MLQQKTNSKKSNKFDVQDSINIEKNYITNFTGYNDYKNNAKVLDIYVNGQNHEKINNGKEGCLIIDPCPFYAESGGQIGDSGFITTDNGKFEVFDTKKHGSTNILYGSKVLTGCINTHDKVVAEINAEKRDNIKINHSATHLHSCISNKKYR